MKYFLPIWAAIIFPSCQSSDAEFENLMRKLASAWSEQNTEFAVQCFTEDAIYMQPPNEQLYVGHEQLRPFFDAIKKGTVMKFHNLWFDKSNQQGAGEFTFGDRQTGTGVTGVVVVKLENGKIKKWREYFTEGPLDFEEFTSTQNKKWKWTIDNYP